MTIVYATHIFDGLDEWATHVAYMRAGSIHTSAPLQSLPEFKRHVDSGSTCPLMRLVESWLREERRAAAEGASAEKEAGDASTESRSGLATSTVSAGGFAPGRLARDNYNYW